MANCPFCSNVLLYHIRAQKTYWFCRRCRTELSAQPTQKIDSLKPKLSTPKPAITL